MDESGKIAVSTGVVFKIGKIPLMVFDAINAQMSKKEPQVPMVYIQDKDREEYNDADPKYLMAIKKHDEELKRKLMDAVFVYGLSVEKVPDTVEKLEDESWVDKERMVGIEFDPGEKNSRFLSWVKYVACMDPKDYTDLFLACARTFGVTEEDVAMAATSFPNRAQRRANPRPLSKTRGKP